MSGTAGSSRDNGHRPAWLNAGTWLPSSSGGDVIIQQELSEGYFSGSGLTHQLSQSSLVDGLAADSLLTGLVAHL